MIRRSAVAGASLAAGALVAGGLTMAQAAPLTLPADQPKKGPAIKWDWRMPANVKTKRPDNIAVHTPLKPVRGYKEYGNIMWGKKPRAKKHRVRLTACKTRTVGKARYRWSIPELGWSSGRVRSCSTWVRLPEGRHTVVISVTDATGSSTETGRMRVKNLLVVIFGDSYSSGVGFPSIDGGRTPWLKPGQPADDPEYDVDDAECFRTRWSGFTRSVVALEKLDRRSNVTLLDVACGGAQVAMPGGLLYPQDNTGGHARPAQVDQVRDLLGDTRIDLAQLSIGGNDTGFGLILGTCTPRNFVPGHPNGCWNAPLPPPTEEAIREVLDYLPTTDGKAVRAIILEEELAGWNLNDQTQLNLTTLAGRYQSLAKCFDNRKGCKTFKLHGQDIADKRTKSKSLNLPAENVLQLMYPNLLRSQTGGLCYGGGLERPLDQDDADWANRGVIEFNRANGSRSITLGSGPGAETVRWTPNGLKQAIRSNRDEGWRTSNAMFDATRDSGMCSTGNAIYPISDDPSLGGHPFTDYTGRLPAFSGVVHPNVLGQALYEDSLLEKSVPMVRLPVNGPKRVK